MAPAPKKAVKNAVAKKATVKAVAKPKPAPGLKKNGASMPSKYGKLADAERKLASVIDSSSLPGKTMKAEKEVSKIRESIGWGKYDGFYVTSKNRNRGVYEPVGNPYKAKVQEKALTSTRKSDKMTNPTKGKKK